MSKRISAAIVFLMAFVVSSSLCAKSLKADLWEQVDSCSSQIISDDPDFTSDAQILEDVRSGYLSVSGTYPACGCGCSNTVAAYKKANGNYLYFGNESWSCSFSYRVYSSESIDRVLPTDFGFSSFAEEGAGEVSDGLFYVQTMIPRKGTDTKIVINAVPFGIGKVCDGSVCYSISATDPTKLTDMYELRELVRKVTDGNLLNKLLNGHFSKLLPDEIALLRTTFGESSCSEASCPIGIELHDYLKTVYRKYVMYKKIRYKEIILGWDKQAGKFFIKNKIGINNHQSFYEFLKSGEFWVPTC